jgi:hypothetical protein
LRSADCIRGLRAIIAAVYETYDQPLISRRAFALRFVRHALVAIALLGGSLLIGIAGYMGLAHLRLVDAFLNAAMILGGMGPVDVLSDDAAKWFAGLYALYSGVIFLVVVGVVFAPVLHRVLHRLHLDTDDDDSDDTAPVILTGGPRVPSDR